jgi:hypothetical protein
MQLLIRGFRVRSPGGPPLAQVRPMINDLGIQIVGADGIRRCRTADSRSDVRIWGRRSTCMGTRWRHGDGVVTSTQSPPHGTAFDPPGSVRALAWMSTGGFASTEDPGEQGHPPLEPGRCQARRCNPAVTNAATSAAADDAGQRIWSGDGDRAEAAGLLRERPDEAELVASRRPQIMYKPTDLTDGFLRLDAQVIPIPLQVLTPTST